MNTDCKLIWESYSYKLITEVVASKANVQRLITKYGIDDSGARALIDRFNEVEGALAKKDIFAYGNIDELDGAIGAVTTEREKTTKGAIIVFENNEVKVLLIRTKEASIKNGRKTKWCISYDDEDDGDVDDGEGNAFYRYLLSEDEPIIYFVISKTNNEKFSILKNKDGSYNYEEIRDKNNEETTLESILSKYKLQESIFKYVPVTNQERLRGAVEEPYDAMVYAKNVIKGRWPEAEPYIMKNASAAVAYARYVIKGRWPEAEPYIMKNVVDVSAYAAYTYAKDVIKGRWPEAEPIIMKSPEDALAYAKDVIKGRWPEAEPIIMKNPKAASGYARHIIKGRWPEAEPYIMKDPEAIYTYAIVIIKGRWPEAEPYIMKGPMDASAYAKDIIKGRWREAEPYIMKDAYAAYTYARDVIKGRWPEAERKIMKDPNANYYYKNEFNL